MHPAPASSAMVVLALTALAGCAAPSEAARQRAMAPPPSPHGFLASAPPADTSFYPLRCRFDGPDTVCKRDSQ